MRLILKDILNEKYFFELKSDFASFRISTEIFNINKI